MKKNILILEDEKLQLDVYSIALEVLGYNVYKSSNSFEGLKTVLNNKIDLILCDIEAENNIGFRFTSLAKTLSPNAEVIMMESHKNRKNHALTSSLGYAYLIKPFSVKILSNLVNSMLREKEENTSYARYA